MIVLTFIAVALPILGILLWAIGYSRDDGRCRGCGYDLRGVEGTRCSECGLKRWRWEKKTESTVDRRVLMTVGAVLVLSSLIVWVILAVLGSFG